MLPMSSFRPSKRPRRRRRPEVARAALFLGDPVLEGTFTSRDMGGIPMQRPEQYGNREFLTPEEFRERATGGPNRLLGAR